MPEKWECHTLIVGGGLSGLACAQVLERAGVDWLLVEKDEEVGGRVRTLATDGFLLDRGFQVLNTAYPALARVVSLSDLELGEFAPGAEVFRDGRFHRLGDPLRRPADLWPTLVAPVGRLADKINILRLVWFCRQPGSSHLVSTRTTEEFLSEFGFSNTLVESFFRPFFGGVFLEEELMTSAGKFVTLFSYFSRGRAALPAEGMQALPRLMASRLPRERLKLANPISTCESGMVITESATVKARHMVLAGWQTQSQILGLPLPLTHSAHTTTYSRPKSNRSEDAYLKLNGSPVGNVQTVAINSAVQPTYSPVDRDLVVVSTRRQTSDGRLREELVGWFGEQVKEWRHLGTETVHQALPHEPLPLAPLSSRVHQGLRVHCCGDHTTTGSIQGALSSGRKAGLAVLGSES